MYVCVEVISPPLLVFRLLECFTTIHIISLSIEDTHTRILQTTAAPATAVNPFGISTENIVFNVLVGICIWQDWAGG